MNSLQASFHLGMHCVSMLFRGLIRQDMLRGISTATQELASQLNLKLPQEAFSDGRGDLSAFEPIRKRIHVQLDSSSPRLRFLFELGFRSGLASVLSQGSPTDANALAEAATCLQQAALGADIPLDLLEGFLSAFRAGRKDASLMLPGLTQKIDAVLRLDETEGAVMRSIPGFIEGIPYIGKGLVELWKARRKIFPDKNQWKNWTLPSKATYVAVWLAVISIVLTVLALIYTKKYNVEGDYVVGNKSSVTHTQGDYIYGDKVSYNTYVTYYTNKDQEGAIVSDATLLNFFYQYSSAYNQIISKVPKKLLQDLPGFLKKPYNINVVVSRCHGVGFEYTVPSNNPEITLIHTTAPIEKHFFTQYTNQSDFPISTKFIKISRKDILLTNVNIVGSKQVFWVIDNADLQVTDVRISYSEDDELKTIDYLWLFGSNSNEYWSQKDPVQLANENVIRLIRMYIVKQEAEASYSLYKKSNS